MTPKARMIDAIPGGGLVTTRELMAKTGLSAAAVSAVLRMFGAKPVVEVVSNNGRYFVYELASRET